MGPKKTLGKGKSQKKIDQFFTKVDKPADPIETDPKQLKIDAFLQPKSQPKTSTSDDDIVCLDEKTTPKSTSNSALDRSSSLCKAPKTTPRTLKKKRKLPSPESIRNAKKRVVDNSTVTPLSCKAKVNKKLSPKDGKILFDFFKSPQSSVCESLTTGKDCVELIDSPSFNSGESDNGFNDSFEVKTGNNDIEEMIAQQTSSEMDRMMTNLSQKFEASNIVASEADPPSDGQILKNFDDFDDMFEDETMDQVSTDVFTRIKNIDDKKRIFQTKKFNTVNLDPSQVHRFKVMDALSTNGSIELDLQHCVDDQRYHCQLLGQWQHTLIGVGDVVHLRYELVIDETITINNDTGFISVNPDTLATSTMLSTAVFCMRKAWLSQQFRGWSFGNKYMLVGTIVHELFQHACKRNLRTTTEIEAVFEQEILDRYDIILQSMLAEMGLKGLRSQVQAYLPNIVDWLNKYMYGEPGTLEDSSQLLHVKKIHDIEDNVWCPSLGVKGKIDVTVEVEIHDRQKQPRKAVIPLELKTGKPSFSFEHRGQVSLYALMMDESLGGRGEINEALLCYLKNGPQMALTEIKRTVKQALIQSRNELTYYMKDFQGGPPPKNSKNPCSMCDHLVDCSLMLKSFEPHKINENETMRDVLMPAAIGHLKERHVNFFSHWMRLMHYEVEESTQKNKSNIFWSESSATCESDGVGLGKLSIKSISDLNWLLVRHHGFLSTLGGLKSATNFVGERVALSVDEENSIIARAASAIGYVIEASDDHIRVELEKEPSGYFQSKMIRLDLVQTFSILSTNFDNLLRLMNDDEYSARLRTLLIDGREPTFGDSMTKAVAIAGRKIIKKLNIHQQKAVLRAIGAADYLLIRGTPGSGKTSTIVGIVRMLIILNQTVLITSHTHSAVDTILLKLAELKIDFIRVGSKNRVHPSLRKYCLQEKTASIKSVSELKKFFNSIKIVAATCLAVPGEPLFGMRKFDVCIMDEASQVLLPTSVGSLFSCRRFIFVGDDKQLPPVIQSKKARENGLSESLFVNLLRPEATVELIIQYRMNREIMRICSELFYDNRLECGSESIAQAVIPKSKKSTKISWIDFIIDHDLQKSFIFLDTDSIGAFEVKDQRGMVYNEIEGKIVKLIYEAFRDLVNVDAADFGVICPFQRQVLYVRELLKDDEDVFVSTVDQYQGKEKKVIVLSCVRSKDMLNVFHRGEEILSDERRLNVAITRASNKVIIVGSRRTLATYVPFTKMFDILRDDQILELPENEWD